MKIPVALLLVIVTAKRSALNTIPGHQNLEHERKLKTENYLPNPKKIQI
jgi:hypothetical protein